MAHQITLVTSNYNLDRLESLITEASTSRIGLAVGNLVTEMTGDDYRRKKG
jgi:DNA replication protein DnaC